MDLGSSGWDGSQSHPCLPERDLARKKKSFSSYFNFQREKFLRQEQDPGWGTLRLVLGIRECLRSSVLPCKFQGLTIKNPIIAVAGVVLIPAAHPKHP